MNAPQIGQVYATPRKSPGVAVLLSILWLGAGHLYAERMTTGLILMAFNGFLALASLIPFVFFITVPIWFLTVPFVAYTAAQAVTQPA